MECQDGFFRGSFCISSTIRLQLSRKRMLNVPWKRCMRNVFWWKPRNAMTFMMKPWCFLFHVFCLLPEGFGKFSQKKLDWSNLLFFRLEIHERAELGPIQARPAAPPRHGMPRVPRRQLTLEGGLCKRWSNSNGFGCCQRAIASTLAGTVFFFKSVVW